VAVCLLPLLCHIHLAQTIDCCCCLNLPVCLSNYNLFFFLNLLGPVSASAWMLAGLPASSIAVCEAAPEGTQRGD
jgi:hypothetical protein